ncbi:MAG: GFA family protein [Xanthobacteraceae bacterium]
MRIDGSCHCGHITFQGEADPEKAWVCHCTDCQAGTGSAFRINVPVAGKDFKMLTGTPTTYVKHTAESGTPRAQAFCPKCGSPIYSTTPGEGTQASYTVRVGLLQQRDRFIPKKQNWYRSAQSWVTTLDGVPKNPKQG